MRQAHVYPAVRQDTNYFFPCLFASATTLTSLHAVVLDYRTIHTAIAILIQASSNCPFFSATFSEVDR